jgi:hypothetical protein
MPTPTYTPLATVTLGSAVNSVTFSSIPATYRDLILVTNGKSSGSDDFYLYFNSDTTSGNYSNVSMFNNVNTPSSISRSNSNAGAIYTSEGSFYHHIMDYSATDKHTTYLGRSSTAGVNVIATAARWANTAAITSVQLKLDSQNLSIGTTLSLYGVIA